MKHHRYFIAQLKRNRKEKSTNNYRHAKRKCSTNKKRNTHTWLSPKSNKKKCIHGKFGISV